MVRPLGWDWEADWEWTECALVDLDGTGWIYTELVGACGNPFSVANEDLGAAMYLALLLAPEGRWHGHHVVVLGSHNPELDRPLHRDVERVKEQLDPRETIDPDASLAPFARRLAERLGVVSFDLHWTDCWVTHASGVEELLPGAICWYDEVEGWVPPWSSHSIIVNEDKQLHLLPAAFGDSPEMLRFATAGDGGAMAALMVLLMTPVRRDDDLFPGPSPLVGSWVGDRISIKSEAMAYETTDASAGIRRVLSGWFTYWRDPHTHRVHRRLRRGWPEESGYWPSWMASPDPSWVL